MGSQNCRTGGDTAICFDYFEYCDYFEKMLDCWQQKTNEET